MIEEFAGFPVLQSIRDSLQEQFAASIVESAFDRGELTVTLLSSDILNVIVYLKREWGFNMLNDMIGLDNLNTRQEGQKRFSILYLLYRFSEALRIRLRIDIDEGETVESVYFLYHSADWAEREIYDMFGIPFNGHPSLKRIYMPDDFDGFPLRKDFPLTGHTPEEDFQ